MKKPEDKFRWTCRSRWWRGQHYWPCRLISSFSKSNVNTCLTITLHSPNKEADMNAIIRPSIGNFWTNSWHFLHLDFFMLISQTHSYNWLSTNIILRAGPQDKTLSVQHQNTNSWFCTGWLLAWQLLSNQKLTFLHILKTLYTHKDNTAHIQSAIGISKVNIIMHWIN